MVDYTVALWAKSPYRKGRVAHWYRLSEYHSASGYVAICGIPSEVHHSRFAYTETPEGTPKCPQCVAAIERASDRRHYGQQRPLPETT